MPVLTAVLCTNCGSRMPVNAEHPAEKPENYFGTWVGLDFCVCCATGEHTLTEPGECRYCGDVSWEDAE